jgi:hypothetical protein
VKGDLDSPEFSYGHLIWKAIANLITKIVTSPFRALAALMPGGSEETLNTVAFEPGRPDVPPPEREKLAKLAGALQKRPQLKLVVEGRYNPETDLAELRMASLRRTLAARQGQKLDPGEDPGPVDYSSAETGKALEAIFTERFGSDALKAIKTDLKATEDKTKKEVAAEGKTAAPESEVKDPGQFAKILFARLADAEPMGEPSLSWQTLAHKPSFRIERSRTIPAERIQVKPPLRWKRLM